MSNGNNDYQIGYNLLKSHKRKLTMKRLTYRGTAYQKSETISKEGQELQRVRDDAPHTYRGIRYHYEAKKKQVA